MIFITATTQPRKHDGVRMPSPRQPGHGSNGQTDASALLNFLHNSGKAISLKANQVLFRENEPCEGAYFVEEGSIELTINSGGRRMHLGSAHPGHLLGISAVLGNSNTQCTATAILSSKVIFVSAETIREYLKSHAEMCLLTVQLLGSEIVDLSANTIRPLRTQPRYPKSH